MATGPSVRLLGECGVTRSFGVVCFFDFPDFSFIHSFLSPGGRGGKYAQDQIVGGGI